MAKRQLTLTDLFNKPKAQRVSSEDNIVESADKDITFNTGSCIESIGDKESQASQPASPSTTSSVITNTASDSQSQQNNSCTTSSSSLKPLLDSDVKLNDGDRDPVPSDNICKANKIIALPISGIPFHPPVTFIFPTTMCGKNKRQCHADWFKNWTWLHYDNQTDSVLYFICAKSCENKLVKTHSYRDPAFVENGFRYWKNATQRFTHHEKSDAHRESVEVMKYTTKPTIIAALSTQVKEDQMKARKALSVIFSSIKYLCKQGFPIRGHDYQNGPLYSLLLERAADVPELKEWLCRRDSWLSNNIQNEIIQMFAHEVQRNIVKEAETSEYISLIADGTTDCAGEEQFSICIQYVTNSLHVHNSFLGFYNSPSSTAVILTEVIKDVLIRLNIPFTKIISCSFDGASNMCGIRNGVQALLQNYCPDMIYIHCCSHSLDLVLQEVAREVKAIADVMQFVRDTSNLIRESSKRRVLFTSMFDQFEDEGAVTNLQSLCPTRWCIRASAMKRTKEAYRQLLDTLVEIKNDTNTRGDCKAKAAGLAKQGKQSKTFFTLIAFQQIFQECEIVARQLQGTGVTGRTVLEMVALLKQRLTTMRNDQHVDKLLEITEQKTADLNLELPVSKRPVKTPARYRATDNFNESGSSDETSNVSYTAKWRREYFEAIDLMLNELDARFNKANLMLVSSREQLLLDDYVQECTHADSDDDNVAAAIKACNLPSSINLSKLSVQLLQWKDLVKLKGIKVANAVDAVNVLQELDVITRSLFSEVEKVAVLVCATPISVANAERSFSCLRRLKTWLRSSMTQARLSQLALLTVHSEMLDMIVTENLMKEFIQKTAERRLTFG